MDPEINKLLEAIPEKPPRSKLEPHADVINALRRKRRTYREIADFFGQHLAIKVSPSTIHDFVRVRRRRGKLLPAEVPKHTPSPPVKAVPSPAPDVQQRIAALKQRETAEAPQPVFTYEEDEPLKLRRKPASDKVD